jgi:hypothetical protein
MKKALLFSPQANVQEVNGVGISPILKKPGNGSLCDAALLLNLLP